MAAERTEEDSSTPPATPPLDPEMARILAEAAAMPRLDPAVTSLAAQRRAVALAAIVWNEPRFPCDEVDDLTIPTAAGDMHARFYRPEGAPADAAILYAHGGGWTFGSLDSHDGLARRLAAACRLPVLSIAYRLAPEHPHPAPVEDAAAGFAFLTAGGLGTAIEPSRIVVAGDSAGAQTVLALLLARRDAGLAKAAAGLLFYGCFAPGFDTPSHRAFGADEHHLLSSARMRWYWANHLGARAADPGLAAPLRADFTDLPPLFLDAASHDPLRDDTLRAAARLTAAGVPNRLRVTPGVVHGYLRFGKRLDLVDETLAAAGRFLEETAGLR